MNFSAFRYFNEVAKAKSIRRAAERLHVAPSAISRQLMQLEEGLGAPLLQRTNVGIELTAAGAIVERYAANVFEDLERLRASIRDFKGLQKGEVKLCVMAGAISHFLPRVISEFNATFPGISFTVTTDSLDRTIESLIRNEADIGVLFHARERPELETLAVYEEPIMCLVGKDHAFAGRDKVTLAEICNVPLALPVASFGLRQLFDRVTAERRLVPKVALSANSLELTRQMAVQGDMVTIGPALSARREIERGLCHAVPIAEPEFDQARAMICVHRERSLCFAATKFLKKMTEEFAKLGASESPQLEAVSCRA